jgi:hypothetical protein
MSREYDKPKEGKASLNKELMKWQLQVLNMADNLIVSRQYRMFADHRAFVKP